MGQKERNLSIELFAVFQKGSKQQANLICFFIFFKIARYATEFQIEQER